ncbi:unnamed protein product, partial [Mesorhabditis spiculigera]
MVLHVHEQISINMPKMIDKAIEISQTITKQKEYASGVLTGEAVRKKADEFEKHFEEYLPHARIYNDKLHVHDMISSNMKRLIEETTVNSMLIIKQKLYANGAAISETLWQKAQAFEKNFEEYLPHARIYNEKLMDLADDSEALLRGFKPMAPEPQNPLGPEVFCQVS